MVEIGKIIGDLKMIFTACQKSAQKLDFHMVEVNESQDKGLIYWNLLNGIIKFTLEVVKHKTDDTII